MRGPVVMTAMKRPHDPDDPRDPGAVDELLAVWDLESPDPVDFLEDEPARRLGCVRHSSTSRDDWRLQRVRLIEEAGPGQELVREVERWCYGDALDQSEEAALHGE